MQKLTIQDHGFMGYWFPGTKHPEKAIISVGGSNCNEKVCLGFAQHLINAGFNVLVLGFYYWKGLSKALSSIPVDYCEKAVRWLQAKQGISRIAMTGMSMGGGYTLLCASLIPDISCIIPIVPFDYIIEGTSKFRRQHCSLYVFHGEDLPYIRMEVLDKSMGAWLRNAHRAEGYGLCRFMRYGYDQADPCLTEDARIKVENIHADILLFAVNNDDCWPSDIAVPRIVEKLQKVDYQHRVESHILNGSHIMPGGLECLGIAERIAFRLIIPTEGQRPADCEAAREFCRKRTIEFIEEW